MATITLVGNIGRNPEQKNANGPVTFGVADKEAYKDDEHPWYDVEAWGKLGERCLEKYAKGMKVLVSGSLVLRKYEGKLYPRLRADRIMPVDPKRDATDATPQSGNEPDDVFVA